MTESELDAPMILSIVEWEGRIRCIYFNDFRICGGKPWGGGHSIRDFKNITIRDLARAVPSLRKKLRLDYLGQPIGPKKKARKP